jgi:RNA polymerase sigma-54 factor
MRFDTSQHVQMAQQMKLAPRMIQSMEILQMPMLALQERVDQELESNIALEVVEPGEDTEAPDTLTQAEEEDRLEERELVVAESPEATEDWQRLSDFESAYGEQFDADYSPGTYSAARMAGERDRKMDALANVPSRKAGLTEQLLEQWSFADVVPAVAALGRLLITYIDEDGLLGADLQTILGQNRGVPDLDLQPQRLEEALREIQLRLDPPGIGGRDRRECILLQIDRIEPEPADEPAWADVRRLVADHFDDLLQNRLPRISQATGMSMDRIHRAMNLMRRLSISPGRELVEEEVPPIIPDIVVEYDEEAGQYTARLSDGLLPALRVSKRYQEMARDRTLDKASRDFVGTNVRNAHWLIDSINQRRQTLLRVVNVVIARQREFIDHGPQHLRPLPMIEVADQLGIHVGTVSRAVADKWVQIPRGMVPLRRFFTGGTETETGQNVSWEAVKARLKEIVDAEDRRRPLSDAALAAELKKGGIDIARRTVVKYRQQLDIPPARLRKEY